LDVVVEKHDDVAGGVGESLVVGAAESLVVGVAHLGEVEPGVGAVVDDDQLVGGGAELERPHVPVDELEVVVPGGDDSDGCHTFAPSRSGATSRDAARAAMAGRQNASVTMSAS